MKFRLFTTTNHHQIGEGRGIRKFISKERSHVMRKPPSICPGGFNNHPLKIAKQHSVDVSRDKFETYYSVKPVFSETRLRRDDLRGSLGGYLDQFTTKQRHFDSIQIMDDYGEYGWSLEVRKLRTSVEFQKILPPLVFKIRKTSGGNIFKGHNFPL